MSVPSTVKQVLIGKETTWGTGVTPAKDAGLIIREATPAWSRAVRESPGLSAIETQKVTSGLFDPKFTLNGEFQHGRLLEYVFGAVAHVETTGDWKHTYAIADIAPSLTLQSAFDLATDIVIDSEGMLVDTATISFETDDVVLLALSLLGKSIDKSNSIGTRIQSTLPTFPHSLVHISLNDVEATICTDTSITVTKKVERAPGAASNLFQAGYATSCTFEWTATLGFTTEQYHELALTGSTGGDTPSATADPGGFNFKFHAHNGVTLGSGRSELSITLASGIIDGFDEPTPVQELTFLTLSAKATLTEAFSVDDISSATW